jgi:phage-related protein
MATEELKIVISVEAQDAINKVKAVKQQVSDLGNTSGTAKVKTAMADSTKEIDKLKEALSKIPGVGGTVATAFGKIAVAVLAIRTSLKWVSLAAQEFFGAFDFKNFDLGGDGIKGLIDTMKISFKEAGVSMGQAFGKGKAAAQGAAAASGEAGAAASGAGAAAGGAAAGFAALAAAVAVVAVAVASLVVSVKNALRYSKELRDTFFEAHKVGLTTAAYQEFSYVLGQVGVGADKLSDFIKSLSAAQNDLRDGSEGMVQAFKDLGLSVEEAVNMSQEELFVETITRLQQMEDGLQRTSIAYRIFGEDDAAEVANLMALNNEEMERMINNFYLLGGGASDSAVQKSLQLQSALSNLRLAWQGLGNTLGEVIMPVVTTVVNALAKAIAVVNMFLRAVFGLDIVAKGTKSVNKASDNLGGYTDSLNDATDAANQLKRSTMGFDELNIVPSGKSGGGGDTGGGSGGGGGGLEIPDLSGMTANLGLDKWAEHFEKFKAAYQTWVPIALTAIGVALAIIGFCTGNIPLGIAGVGLAGLGITVGIQNGAWAKMFNGILSAFQSFGAWFKKIWGDLSAWWSETWNAIKTTAANVWNAIATFFSNCWNGIKNVATTVWNAVKQFFSDCWNGIKNIATTVWNAIKNFFTNSWNAIKTTATNVWNGIKSMLENIWNAIKTAATNLLDNLKTFFSNCWEFIKNVWSVVTQFFVDIWEGIKTSASNLVENVKTFFSNCWNGIKAVWDAVKGYFQAIWNAIKSGASAMWEGVKGFFSGAWTAIKGVWSVVGTWFGNIWTSIKNTFSGVGTWFKNIFQGAWNGIKSIWNSVGTFFTNVWTTIKNIFSKVGTSIADGVTGAVKGAINSVLSSVVSKINTFIGWINGAVDLINKIPGVSIGKIGKLSVPQLATGGIVTGNILANIGERGREAVLPLENNTGWMDILADRIAARNSSPSKVVLMLDGHELGWATIRNINAITKQTGGLQLLL